MITERRSCVGKTRFETKADAKRARRRIYGLRSKAKNGPLSIYSCGFCGFYHLGHMPTDVRNGTYDKDAWTGVRRVRD